MFSVENMKQLKQNKCLILCFEHALQKWQPVNCMTSGYVNVNKQLIMIIKYIFENVLCRKLLPHKTLSNIFSIIVDEYTKHLFGTLLLSNKSKIHPKAHFARS